MNFALRIKELRDKLLAIAPRMQHIIDVDLTQGETDAEALTKYELKNEINPADIVMFVHLVGAKEIAARRKKESEEYG